MEITDHLRAFGFRDDLTMLIIPTLYLDLGRNRKIKVMSPGTPNEMVFITSAPADSVCLRNWDYDGPLTKEKIKQLLKFFDKNEQEEIKSVHPHPDGKDSAP